MITRLANRIRLALKGSPRQKRFKSVLKAASDVAALDKYALTSFARAIARPMQARRLTVALLHPQHAAPVNVEFDKLFFPTYRPITSDGKSLGALLDKAPASGRLCLYLSRDVLVPGAWHRERLINALATIGSTKRVPRPWTPDINHQVQILLPFGLGIVNGGNHSITAGIADGEGAVPAEPLDLSESFKHVLYDGHRFLRRHDSEMLSEPIEEEPGMLFEIGRMMSDLGVTYDSPRWSDDQRADEAVIQYRVHIDGRDSGYNVFGATIMRALLDAGIERNSDLWDAVLYRDESLALFKGRTFRFEPHGKRPVADGLDFS